MPKWNYYVLKASKTTDGPIVKGSTFHQVRKNDAQDLKVIEFEFPNIIAIESLFTQRRLTMRFKLSHAGSFTRIEDMGQLEAS